MTQMGRRWHVVGGFGIGALMAVTLVPIGPSAAVTVPANTDRSCGSDPPIVEMRTFNRVGCVRADQVTYGITARFNEPSQFHGTSGRGIRQRDDRHKVWRCRWQSADVHNNSVIWACKFKRGIITWAWRNPD